MARADGPFDYFDQLHAKGKRTTGSTIRAALSAPETHANTLLTLADELAGDKKAVTGHTSGSIVGALAGDTGKVEKSSRSLAGSGLYFIGLATEFSLDVDSFDTTVDGINTDWAEEVRTRVKGMKRIPEVQSGEIPINRPGIESAVETRLQGRYTTARSTLDTGINSVETRLGQGPTDDNVRDLIVAGLLPMESASAFPTLALTPADVSRAIGNSFWKEWLGLRPPFEKGPMDWFGWAFGTLGFGVGAGIDWATKYKYGGFKPIGANGRFVRVSSLTVWDRFRAGLGRFPTGKGLNPWQRITGFNSGGHFGPKGWKGAEFNRWSTIGKWSTRAGGAVTAVTSGWNEWNESAEYPTDERVGRTVTKAAATTTGALLGAKGGAMLGGAIGTAICPGAGTIIGGAVGGLVGGFVGSEVGGAVGDWMKDTGGKIASGVADTAKDIGDKLTFWD